MLILRNARFEDRHPFRAWLAAHRHVLVAHAMWGAALICLQVLAAAPPAMMG